MAGTIDVGTIKVGGLAELKAELRALKGELANATDPQQMQRLAEAAGAVSDQIKDANEQVAVFATGSKFEATSNAFGLMKSQLMDLDFEGAANSAKLFQQTLGSITPAQIGTQIKGLISVIGSLSKAFIQFGLSLLANPVFILAAAITAIVAVIGLVLNKLGILQPIIDAVSDAFGALMSVIDGMAEGFKGLIKWLGLTGEAAEDSAKKQIEASQKASEAAKAKSEIVIDAMDHEIALLRAAGKETGAAEEEKQKYILETAKIEQKRMEQRIKNGILSFNIDAEEIGRLKEQQKAVQEANQALEVLQTENITKRNEKAKKAAADAKAAREKEEQERIKFEQDRLAFTRQFQDLELELTEDGLQKELLANQYKYQREIEDLKFNKNLQLEERLKLETELGIVMGAKAAEIRAAHNEKQLQQEREFQAKLKELTMSGNISRSEIINQDYQKQLDDFKKLLDNKTITQEQYNQLAAAAETQRQTNQETLNAEYANRNQAAEISMMAEGFDKKRAQLDFQQQQELAGADLTETEKTAIQVRFAEERAKLDEQERIAKVEAVNKTTQMMGDATKTGLQGISDIVGAFAGKSVSQQKRAFEIQKKINIVMATIDMIKGAVSAFSNAMQLGPIAGPIVGSLVAASVVASGVANIKKISQTKFEGGGSTAPTAPSTNTGGASTAGQAEPSFNLFGQPNQANTMTAQKPVEATTTIQAVVVESEVTATQNKVKRMQESATL